MMLNIGLKRGGKMELYVKGEMPKSCWECPCFKNDIECCCGLDDGTNDYFLDEIDGGECPLKSLDEHDKYVCKKIGQGIKDKGYATLNYADGTYDYCINESALGDVLSDAIKEKVQ